MIRCLVAIAAVGLSSGLPSGPIAAADAPQVSADISALEAAMPGITEAAIRAELLKSAQAQRITLEAAARQAASELLPLPNNGGRVTPLSKGGETTPKNVQLPDADRRGDFMVYPSSFGHAALYSRKDEIVHSPGGSEKIQTRKVKGYKVPSGVAVLRVKDTSDKTRDKAISFALDQRGKPYNPNYFDTKVYAQSYYCSQLVWAAYMTQGIDLDGGGWWGAVSPGELKKTDRAKVYVTR